MSEQEPQAEAAATSSTKIHGIEFTVPNRYAEGHALNAAEAAALNRIIVENLGNNFRGTVNAVKKELEGAGKTLADLSAKQTSALRDKFNAKAEGYEIGMVRTGGGGGSAMDPVEREARTMALNAVKDAYRKANKGIKDNMDAIKAKTEEVFTANEKVFMERAKVVVDARNGATATIAI